MEALGASHLKFFLSRQREGERVAVSRHEFGCVLHQKLVLFRANCVASISSQTKLESEAIQPLNLDQPKMVRVRFKLHKQCAFGQQFLVVGDDPILGSWDPSGGVPLTWSEGHVWTAEVDMPCGKVVSYKFVLEEIDGTVLWQPGTDRVLETWDAAKTISVSEDWDSPDFKSVVEEEPVVVDGVSESSLDDPGLLIGEHWDQMDDDSSEEEEEVCVEISSLDKGGDDVMREEIGGDDSDEPSLLMVAENISLEEEEETTLGDLGGSDDSSLLENGTSVVRDGGVPVLVLGLGALPREEVEEAETSIIDRSTADVCDEILEATTTVFDEIEDSTDLNNGKVVEIDDSADLNPRNNNENEDANEPEIRVSAVANGDKNRILDTERNSVVEDIATESDQIEHSAESNPNEAANEPVIRVSAVVNGDKNRILDTKRNNVVEDIATESESDQIEQSNEAAIEAEIRVSAVVNRDKNRILDKERNNVVEDIATESDQIEHSAESPANEGEIRVSARAEASEVTEEEEKPRLGGAKKQILENDMKWGRRALHKFLANLGFMQHS